MPAKGYKTVKKKLADGSVKVFYYHRETGARLPDNPDTPAFRRAVAKEAGEAAKERAFLAERTINWLIREYSAAPDWTGLAPGTRKIESFNIMAIEREFGDMPLSAVEERGARAIFLSWRDEVAREHPRAADAKLARLARILAFGVDREYLLVNPIAKVRRVYDGDRAEIIWLPTHIDAFMAVAKPPMDLCLMLGLHTGQRRGDILALRWSAYDGAGIAVRQSKTNARVYVPCTVALKETLDALPRTGETIVTTKRGKQLGLDNFKTMWKRTFEKAAIKDDLHFHDLRGTAVTMLAEAGCSVPEIASITGHTLDSVTKILERYLAPTRRLAESAIAKLEARLKK